MVASGTVDAVITTVPHYLHHEIAIYCLEHGMNVLVEKPAGVRAKDVMAMNKCAEEHPDVAFGIMFNQRTNKLYQKIKEIVASGELGEIRRSNWIINTGQLLPAERMARHLGRRRRRCSGEPGSAPARPLAVDLRHPHEGHLQEHQWFSPQDRR